MYPHERSLVKRLEGRPFAIVGVNSDDDLAALQPILAQESITWRSFWNGPKGTKGSISQRWNLRGWPTLVLIDHEGVIVQRWSGSPGEAALDAAIDAAVQRAESPK